MAGIPISNIPQETITYLSTAIERKGKVE